MSDRKPLAIGGLAGLGYAVLELTGLVVGGAANPVPFDNFPSAATAARIAATPVPAGVWLGFGLEVLSTLLLLVFMVRVAAGVRRSDGHGLLATATLAAGIVNVATVFVSFGIMAARYAGAGHGLDGQSVVLLAILSLGCYFLTWPSLAMFVGGVAIGAIRTRVLPAWLGWAGLVVAAAELVACVVPEGVGPLAQFLPIIWIGAAGVALTVRRSVAADSAPIMMSA